LPPVELACGGGSKVLAPFPKKVEHLKNSVTMQKKSVKASGVKLTVGSTEFVLRAGQVYPMELPPAGSEGIQAPNPVCLLDPAGSTPDFT
jgi:hypothetical protein